MKLPTFKKMAVKKLAAVVISVALTVGLVNMGVPAEAARQIGTAAAALVSA